jgi:hypothetical protein
VPRDWEDQVLHHFQGVFQPGEGEDEQFSFHGLVEMCYRDQDLWYTRK